MPVRSTMSLIRKASLPFSTRSSRAHARMASKRSRLRLCVGARRMMLAVRGPDTSAGPAIVLSQLLLTLGIREFIVFKNTRDSRIWPTHGDGNGLDHRCLALAGSPRLRPDGGPLLRVLRLRDERTGAHRACGGDRRDELDQPRDPSLVVHAAVLRHDGRRAGAGGPHR